MKIRIPRVESKNKDNVQRRDTEPGDWIDASRRMSVWSLPEDPHERRRIRNAARYRTFRKPAPAGLHLHHRRWCHIPLRYDRTAFVEGAAPPWSPCITSSNWRSFPRQRRCVAADWIIATSAPIFFDEGYVSNCQENTRNRIATVMARLKPAIHFRRLISPSILEMRVS
jgi:hypothetical protein